MNTRDRLIDLMTRHGIDRREVAELVKVKAEVVNRWLLSHESRHQEDAPEMAVELLEYKLRERASGSDSG